MTFRGLNFTIPQFYNASEFASWLVLGAFSFICYFTISQLNLYNYNISVS